MLRTEPKMGQHDFSMPPPIMSDIHQNNANLTTINPMANANRYASPRFRPPFRPQHNNQLLNSLPDDFDGKRLRKSNMRKTVDYNSAISRALQNRVWQRDHRDRHALQPDVLYLPDLLPPPSYQDNPINAVTTRFVKTATNKMRCPIFCMAWTPEGRRLVTGASSGEFTLWNGLTFNFETILQAHDSPVRSMVWSHNDGWMITGDHAGYCKYWQSNMNNVKMFQAHKEAIRGLSFSPTDQKIVSCSDDGTLRIWDFLTCQEERVLRGHGSDVKCCGWHPHLGLIASGSKDNQQPIKLWDPKSGTSLTTLHAHKATVMDLKWNQNGNWFMTASRDHFLKLFDIRSLGQPVQTFRGHKKEASCIAWHPHHEGLLASGGSDGAILFWHVGADKEVGSIDAAHDSIVWTLDWHPLGHILCSGSNDHTSKFWTRNRPGDKMRDRYNLNLGAPGSANDDGDMPEEAVIPGMAPEDRVDMSGSSEATLFSFSNAELKIPGLEESDFSALKKEQNKNKKHPYSKPIPKNFVASWNETSTVDEEEEALEGYGTESVLDPIATLVSKLVESQPGVKRVEELVPNGLIAYGQIIPIKRGSTLFRRIHQGQDSLQAYLTSGKVKQLANLPGFPELAEFHESDSEDSSYEGDGRTPTREEMNIDKLDLEEYLKPFSGFKEVDLDDVPYRDKETRDLPRGRDDDRWDDEDRGRRWEREERDRDRDRELRGNREDRSSRGWREDRDRDRERDKSWDDRDRDRDLSWDNRDRDVSWDDRDRDKTWDDRDRDRDRRDWNDRDNMMPPANYMGPMGNFMGPMGPMMGPGFMMGNFGPMGNMGPMGLMGNFPNYPNPTGYGPNMMGYGGAPMMMGPGNNFGGQSRNNDDDEGNRDRDERWSGERKRPYNDEASPERDDEDDGWRRGGGSFRGRGSSRGAGRGRGGTGRPPRRGARGGRYN